SPNAPSESNSRPHPTRPSSGSAHNSPSPRHQISPPPSPAPPPAARSPKQSSPLRLLPRSPPHSSRCPHPPTPQSHPPTRCPPPTPPAPLHNSQSCVRSSRNPYGKPV